MWFQKSLEKWIRLGSRNIAFFHAQTVIRRKRNKIHGLTLPLGVWCTNVNVLQEESLNFYKDLFCSKENLGPTPIGSSVPSLSNVHRWTLFAPVSKEKVFAAFMSMKSYKSLGLDGFQPIFFKMFWDVVGDDLWRFVAKAFGTGVMDLQVFETLMVLIPKGDHPSTLRDYCPISLHNVIYKLVTKVLVNRLRPMPVDIVSPLYSSFIPGRGTVDNAIIPQEFIHHMHKSKRRKGEIIYKLDLEKAYDRVDWYFLRETLVLFGFPEDIISLIMSGLSTNSISLLWNGRKTPPFVPRRGLRQGDPLSSYLFVLCMERLGAIITFVVQQGHWQPLCLTCDGPRISHLFFADDVLFFGKATPSQACFVSDLLQ